MRSLTLTRRTGVVLGALLIAVVLPLEARQDRSERRTGPTIQVPTSAPVNAVVKRPATSDAAALATEPQRRVYDQVHWGIDNQNSRVQRAAARRRAEAERREWVRRELERITPVILPISPDLGAAPPVGGSGVATDRSTNAYATLSAIERLLFIADWHGCFDGVAVDALPGTTAALQGRSSFISDTGRYIPIGSRTHPVILGWIPIHARASVSPHYGCLQRPILGTGEGDLLAH